jgi:drug/metabolite transporter (DMT)-like permease
VSVGDGPRTGPSIWWWAFGYFAAYAPYSALTKALSDGALGERVSGNAILPLSTSASLLAMVVFVFSTGWWRFASRTQVGPLSLPTPTRWTALSGLCGATILTTTTLAYTFEGVSIVFMMLLMRGGVLLMAPLVDLLSGRKVRWYSWLALGLTLSSLAVATLGRAELRVSVLALVNVALYLGAYFVRLRFMSRLAKSDDPAVTRRYFVEEQFVSTPAALVALALFALIGEGSLLEFRRGFLEVPFSPQVGWALVIGVLSQGTGIFGALVLLDARENSFSVPVNRASSVLAGVVATVGMAALALGKPLEPEEAVGAALVVLAILVLSVTPMVERRRQRSGSAP